VASAIHTNIQRGRRSGLQSKSHSTPTTFPARAKAFWLNLGANQKRLIGVVFLGLLLLGGGLFGRAQSNAYVELYPLKMNSEDVKDVSTVLTELQIEHQVKLTGDQVLVHPSKRLLAQARLAERNLPRRNPEPTPEEEGFSQTRDSRVAAERRKLESEIVHTLRELESVNDARVRIAVPESRFFAQDDKPVTASVLLKVAGSGRLSEETVTGIASLIAHSVPELAVENVTILDHDGQSIKIQEDAEGTRFDIQRDQERHLQAKLQEALARVYGSRVHAVVNLDLDFSHEEQRRYTPGDVSDRGKVEDSLQRFEETLQGGEKDSDRNYKELKESVNYKYAENYFARLRREATVERLTATVMVDGAGEKEVEDVRSIVAGCIGLDESRGDHVYVSGAPWNRSLMDQWNDQPMPLTQPSVEQNGSFAETTGWVALGVTLTLLSCLVGSALVKRTKPILPVALGGEGAAGPQGIVGHEQSKNGENTGLGETACHQNGRVQALEQMIQAEPSKVLTHLKSTWLS